MSVDRDGRLVVAFHPAPPIYYLSPFATVNRCALNGQAPGGLMFGTTQETWATDNTMDLSTAEGALAAFDKVGIDRVKIPQERLDLTTRSRKSQFPWRGQFSPELVELLLATHADQGDLVLDPFAGSGTTLFEASRHGLNSVGSEIHPAAVVMAGTTRFAALDSSARRHCLDQFASLVQRWWPYSLLEGMGDNGDVSSRELLHRLLNASLEDKYLSNLSKNLVIRLSDRLKTDERISTIDVWSNVAAISQIVLGLPYSAANCRVLHADARQLPIPNGTIDLIVTSPPYINVFNYHQNYRSAIELLGWDALQVARSEFGANRKNRGNRFLTVVQYAMDMLATLHELRRVLKPHGRLLVVVGRESSVRSIRFENGRIVAALAIGSKNYYLERRQERKFKTRFGQLIYEDILHLTPTGQGSAPHVEFGRAVGEALLRASLTRADRDIRADIEAALEGARTVQESSMFVNTPKGRG